MTIYSALKFPWLSLWTTDHSYPEVRRERKTCDIWIINSPLRVQLPYKVLHYYNRCITPKWGRRRPKSYRGFFGGGVEILICATMMKIQILRRSKGVRVLLFASSWLIKPIALSFNTSSHIASQKLHSGSSRDCWWIVLKEEYVELVRCFLVIY